MAVSQCNLMEFVWAAPGTVEIIKLVDKNITLVFVMDKNLASIAVHIMTYVPKDVS